MGPAVQKFQTKENYLNMALRPGFASVVIIGSIYSDPFTWQFDPYGWIVFGN